MTGEHDSTIQPAAEPSFDELPRDARLGLAHSWEVLDHDLGTLARSTADHVARAAELVREGAVLSLNLELGELAPPLFGRAQIRHEIFATDRNTLDDRVDDFYPQGSSQWDGLRHVRARELGFFGGAQGEFSGADGGLGIEHWARRGIVGRGVLLDVAARRALAGASYDPFAPEPIEADELREIVQAQGTELRRGDVICVRTGWVDAYRRLDRGGRELLAREAPASGLAGSEDVARFLWDSGAIAVASDNPTLEVRPGDAAVGSLHRRLIPMLGFVVGELLDLGELSRACARDRRWDFMFVAAPMNLPGGVGSPANALAIR